MDNLPYVSVIIPVYNVAPYLRDCIGSILNQTLQNIEVICVDDGSTDGSLDILEEYKNTDKRVCVVRQQNSGAAIARNNGLAIAKGEYLSILDSDDFFKPTMLEEAYYRAKETDADIVVYRFHRYDHISGREYDQPHMNKKSNFPNTPLFSIADIQKMGKNYLRVLYGWTWDKLFSRKYIEKQELSFQNVKIYNDMFFTYSALATSQKITFIDAPLMCQRVNRAGSITKSAQKNWVCIFDALKKVKDYLISNNLFDNFEKEFKSYAIRMLIYTYGETSGTEQRAMAVVCEKFGFHYLDIDLSVDSDFQIKDELIEARNLFTSASNMYLSETNIDAVKLSSEIQKVKNDYVAVLSSKSYRIGRFITFIPRKIRGGIRCYKEHGMRYTMRRIKEKFRNLFRKKAYVK